MEKLEFRALRADEVDVRIGTVKEGEGVSLLLYKDARCDMNILDETVGSMRWQRSHELINGNLFCNVGILDPESGWVWKQDVGTESNTEAEKGQASDAFKRACFCWGIGRELYTAPFIWIAGAGKKDKFWVKDLKVEDHRITSLTVCRCNKYGDHTDAVAFSYPRAARPAKSATPEQVAILEKTYVGANLDKLLKANGIDRLDQMLYDKAADLIRKLNSRKEGA